MPTSSNDASDESTPSPGSVSEGIAYGLVAGAICALILFSFAALLSFSAGLVVVAFFLGRIVGLSVRAGARESFSSATRTSVAVLISLGAVTVALVATWVFARQTGGVLGPWEYLTETLGPIVPLQYMVATLAAWWTSR